MTKHPNISEKGDTRDINRIIDAASVNAYAATLQALLRESMQPAIKAQRNVPFLKGILLFGWIYRSIYKM